MHMEPNKVLTPEEKATLQEEIVKAVEAQLAIDAEMTRADAINAVVEAVKALQAEPEMGGMGAEAEAGMKMPEEEGEEEGE